MLIATAFKPIIIRQNKYLNNRIEQDHRFIKKRVRVMLGLKSFRSAQIILSGIELMHMMRKDQFNFMGSNDSIGSFD
jgi:putative transposase